MDDVTAEMIERGRGSDGDRSQQRRRTATQLKEAREKLTSNTYSAMEDDRCNAYASVGCAS